MPISYGLPTLFYANLLNSSIVHNSKSQKFFLKSILKTKVTFLVHLLWVIIWIFYHEKLLYILGWVEFYRYQKFKVGLIKIFFLDLKLKIMLKLFGFFCPLFIQGWWIFCSSFTRWRRHSRSTVSTFCTNREKEFKYER